MLAILSCRQDETCVSGLQGMAVEVASVEVIEGIEGGDAVVHGLNVGCTVRQGFSAEEADLLFGGELAGHWGSERRWGSLSGTRWWLLTTLQLLPTQTLTQPSSRLVMTGSRAWAACSTVESSRSLGVCSVTVEMPKVGVPKRLKLKDACLVVGVKRGRRAL